MDAATHFDKRDFTTYASIRSVSSFVAKSAQQCFQELWERLRASLAREQLELSAEELEAEYAASLMSYGDTWTEGCAAMEEARLYRLLPKERFVNLYRQMVRDYVDATYPDLRRRASVFPGSISSFLNEVYRNLVAHGFVARAPARDAWHADNGRTWYRIVKRQVAEALVAVTRITKDGEVSASAVMSVHGQHSEAPRHEEFYEEDQDGDDMEDARRPAPKGRATASREGRGPRGGSGSSSRDQSAAALHSRTVPRQERWRASGVQECLPSGSRSNADVEPDESDASTVFSRAATVVAGLAEPVTYFDSFSQVQGGGAANLRPVKDALIEDKVAAMGAPRYSSRIQRDRHAAGWAQDATAAAAAAAATAAVPSPVPAPRATPTSRGSRKGQRGTLRALDPTPWRRQAEGAGAGAGAGADDTASAATSISAVSTKTMPLPRMPRQGRRSQRDAASVAANRRGPDAVAGAAAGSANAGAFVDLSSLALREPRPEDLTEDATEEDDAGSATGSAEEEEDTPEAGAVGNSQVYDELSDEEAVEEMSMLQRV